MGAQSDQLKGRAKEAAGILTGNDDHEAEGSSDRLSAKAHEKIAKAKDKVAETVGKTRKALRRT